MNKKILFLTSHFDPRHRVCVGMSNLAVEFKKRGFDVSVISLNDIERNYIYEGIKVESLQVKDNKNIIELIKSFIYIYLYLKKNKPDFLFSFDILPSGIIAALATILLKIPSSVQAMGSDIHFSIKNPKYKLFHKFAMRYCTYVFAQNSAHRDIMENFSKRNVHVLPACIRRSNKLPNLAKSKGKHFRIIFTGRIRALKGLHFLIEAMCKVDNSELVVAGNFHNHPNYKKKIDNLISKYDLSDRVKFLGFVVGINNVRELYKQSDVFVLPSYYDACPSSLREAMDSGVPVVASSVTGPRDMIIHKKTGFLFKSKNVEELAKWLNYIKDNKSKMKSIINKSYEHLIYFDVSYVADKFQRLCLKD
jgi:glycosyltransferase involved in cell wall biosynthesis